MRWLLSVLMMGQLTGCIWHPLDPGYSDKTVYRPYPAVEISMFTAKDRVLSAYVRHSGGAVLFRLSPENSDHEYGAASSDVKCVLTLSSAETINFSPTPYESFDRSFDMFQDGRIILVPLTEQDGKAVGAFVNLVSGKRYFLAPTVRSRESLAQIRTIANRWPGVTVIVPEDRRAADRVAQFPEFRR